MGLAALKKFGLANFWRPAKEKVTPRKIRNGSRAHSAIVHARTGAPNGKRRSRGAGGGGGGGGGGMHPSCHSAIALNMASLRSYLVFINENERVQSATIVSYLLHEIHKLPTGLTYALVTVLVFGEAAIFLGFVLPGETAVLVAGVAASQGHVNIGVVCVLVVVAATAGDSVGFAIGHRYGERLMRLKILHRRRAALDRALEGLRRRGPIYVFVGRFTAFMRAVMRGSRA